MKWKDFNGDGKIDATERFLWDELMCTSKEEHEALLEMPEISMKMMTTRMTLTSMIVIWMMTSK